MPDSRRIRHPLDTEPTAPEGNIVTRALRSHQLWLTVAYFGILGLMARGFAS